MSMDVSHFNYDDLMQRYLDVCNQAMTHNRDRFPFKQILGAALKAENDKLIEVNIVDDLPPVSYVMRFGKNGLVAQPHAECEPCACDRQWNVNRTYLADVAKNAESYIDNPAKIDWGWMYDSTG